MHRFVAIVAGIAVVCMCSSVLAYSGSMTSSSGLVVSGSGWIQDDVSLTWNVTQNADNSWRYAYTFTSPTPELSHWILEVSPSFGLGEILNLMVNGSAADIGDHVANVATQNTNNGNTGMPEAVYGIKFEVPQASQSTKMTYQFDAFRVPVWVDFFAKAGRDSYAYNSGFSSSDQDPIAPAADGTGPAQYGHHLLGPDTHSTKTPEPGALALLGAGAVTVWARRRRR